MGRGPVWLLQLLGCPRSQGHDASHSSQWESLSVPQPPPWHIRACPGASCIITTAWAVLGQALGQVLQGLRTSCSDSGRPADSRVQWKDLVQASWET